MVYDFVAGVTSYDRCQSIIQCNRSGNGNCLYSCQRSLDNTTCDIAGVRAIFANTNVLNDALLCPTNGYDIDSY